MHGSRGVAVTSGNSDYREALERIPKGSLILAYASKRIRESPPAQPQGLVAVGEVLDDELVEVAHPDTISPFEPIEFHRNVSWLRDLRSSPIERAELMSLLGQGPMHAVQEVLSSKRELLGRLELIALTPTADPREYARSSAFLRGLGPMMRPVGAAAPRRLVASAAQFYRDPKVRACPSNARMFGCQAFARHSFPSSLVRPPTANVNPHTHDADAMPAA